MATHLDLEEQEQLDQLKHYWNRYGNLITWIATGVLAVVAGYYGWTWWQRDQATKASAMYEALDRAASTGDADKAARAFADLKERFPATAYAQQGGLLAAKVAFEKGQVDAATAALAWVADHAQEPEYRTIARLRAAGIALDQKKYDEALKLLDAANAPDFAALVADRRGDVFVAQGKNDAAIQAYRSAWQAMDSSIDYRRLIEAKLIALGVAPPASAASAASGAVR